MAIARIIGHGGRYLNLFVSTELYGSESPEKLSSWDLRGAHRIESVVLVGDDTSSVVELPSSSNS